MKRTIINSILAISLLSSCSNEIPTMSLGIADAYAVERMKSIILHPQFDGNAFEWSMKDQQGNDSIISTDRDFAFVSAVTGKYTVKLRIIDEIVPLTHEVKFIVWEEQIAHSRYVTKVHEYRPAPGQFVNNLPQYEEGDTEESMRRKAEESLSGKNDVLVSLGGFGGYIVLGFDHTIVNVRGKKDFKILANAFYAATNPNPSSPTTGGSVEPGVVMVSFDRNKNGIPDDDWYELAGSEYYKPETIKNYEITYHRPDPNKQATPNLDYEPLIDTTYLLWKDNQNQQGYLDRNVYHLQDYYPKWIKSNQLSFKGTKLANNAVDESGRGVYYVQYAYAWGYVDNHPNEPDDKISFDIDWAVDKNGKSVHLPGVDFIKVYTGVNQKCGWLGETSTEISRVEDLHVKDYANY